MAIDKRQFRVTKKGTAYRSKRQKGNNYDEKRGAVGFRGNSQAGANCQENDFVAIDGGARRVTKKQTDFRDNRLDPISKLCTAYLLFYTCSRFELINFTVQKPTIFNASNLDVFKLKINQEK